MKISTFLNMRWTLLCQAALMAGLVLTVAPGCGNNGTTTTESGATDDTSTAEDGTVSTDDTSGSTDDTSSDTIASDIADTAEPKDATETADVGVDTQDAGTDATIDIQKDTNGLEKLLCKEAKGSCALCSLCPAFPVCTLASLGGTDLKTYPNDCAAICALNATKWPEEVGGADPATGGKLWPTKCPACPACTPDDMDKAEPGSCVTTNSGTSVTVDHLCEAACVPDVKLDANNKPIAKSGKCKLACTDPVPAGGGCTSKLQPVCSATDGNTYVNACQMQNCDKKGCFPEGTQTLSTTCTPGSMTKECDGECYDKSKTPNCSVSCNPTCARSTKKLNGGQVVDVAKTFRSSCVAQAEGYKTGDCTGVSATPADTCSYQIYDNRPCCADVDYGFVFPVCASQPQTGKPDLFVTFVNKGEFDCFAKADPTWLSQYDGACVCNCTANEQPQCGADGITYLNPCQAQCYNKDNPAFTFVPGPCP